jgi:hypothetical protein
MGNDLKLLDASVSREAQPGLRLWFADDPLPEPIRGLPRPIHTGIHCHICDVEKRADNHWFQVRMEPEFFIIAPLKSPELSEGFVGVCGEAHADKLKTQWFTELCKAHQVNSNCRGSE